MVCETCNKKKSKIVTPDTWKAGARNTIESGGRKLNENKALTKYKNNSFTFCKFCNQKLHQEGLNYCHECAFKKSLCAMCGNKMENL